MKKTAIFCLVTLLIGAGLVCIGILTGGSIYSVYPGGKTITFTPFFSGDKDADAVTAGNGNAGGPPSLQLKLERGDFRLMCGDTFDVTGGTIIEQETDDEDMDLSVRGVHGQTAVITIPDRSYDEFSLDAGACRVEMIDPINAMRIELDLGAGELSCEALTADRIKLDIGAGHLSSSMLNAKTLDINVGAGGLDATIANSEEDYHWSADVALGAFTLNGVQRAAGISSIGSAGAGERRLKIDVGAGAVSLLTQTGS